MNMPKGKIHQAISNQRTGKTYKELHSWIDENKEDIGVNHRNKNHYYTEELREFISKKFGGPEAVSEWLFHIALDNLDTSVSNDWIHNLTRNNFHSFGFCEDGFIYYLEDELDKEELEEEFYLDTDDE